MYRSGSVRIVTLVLSILTFKMASLNPTKSLALQGFLPMTGSSWTAGGACLPAVLMALRHVNERPGLLDGYNLTYTWVDTQVTFCIYAKRGCLKQRLYVIVPRHFVNLFESGDPKSVIEKQYRPRSDATLCGI